MGENGKTVRAKEKNKNGWGSVGRHHSQKNVTGIVLGGVRNHSWSRTAGKT